MIPGNVGEFQTLFREIQKFLFFSDKFWKQPNLKSSNLLTSSLL